VKKARKRFTVIITYRKSNKNSLVLQQMLKMLPSRPNALSTLVGDVVYFLEVLQNCCNHTVLVVS